MLMAAAELLESKPDASREDVRLWMSGNYCRCTGYQSIVDALCDVLASRQAAVAEAEAEAEAMAQGASA